MDWLRQLTPDSLFTDLSLLLSAQSLWLWCQVQLLSRICWVPFSLDMQCGTAVLLWDDQANRNTVWAFEWQLESFDWYPQLLHYLINLYRYRKDLSNGRVSNECRHPMHLFLQFVLLYHSVLSFTGRVEMDHFSFLIFHYFLLCLHHSDLAEINWFC